MLVMLGRSGWVLACLDSFLLKILFVVERDFLHGFPGIWGGGGGVKVNSYSIRLEVGLEFDKNLMLEAYSSQLLDYSLLGQKCQGPGLTLHPHLPTAKHS